MANPQRLSIWLNACSTSARRAEFIHSYSPLVNSWVIIKLTKILVSHACILQQARICSSIERVKSCIVQPSSTDIDAHWTTTRKTQLWLKVSDAYFDSLFMASPSHLVHSVSTVAMITFDPIIFLSHWFIMMSTSCTGETRADEFKSSTMGQRYCRR